MSWLPAQPGPPQGLCVSAGVQGCGVTRRGGVQAALGPLRSPVLGCCVFHPGILPKSCQAGIYFWKKVSYLLPRGRTCPALNSAILLVFCSNCFFSFLF